MAATTTRPADAVPTVPEEDITPPTGCPTPLGWRIAVAKQAPDLAQAILQKQVETGYGYTFELYYEGGHGYDHHLMSEADTGEEAQQTMVRLMTTCLAHPEVARNMAWHVAFSVGAQNMMVAARSGGFGGQVTPDVFALLQSMGAVPEGRPALLHLMATSTHQRPRQMAAMFIPTCPARDTLSSLASPAPSPEVLVQGAEIVATAFRWHTALSEGSGEAGTGVGAQPDRCAINILHLADGMCIPAARMLVDAVSAPDARKWRVLQGGHLAGARAALQVLQGCLTHHGAEYDGGTSAYTRQCLKNRQAAVVVMNSPGEVGAGVLPALLFCAWQEGAVEVRGVALDILASLMQWEGPTATACLQAGTPRILARALLGGGSAAQDAIAPAVQGVVNWAGGQEGGLPSARHLAMAVVVASRGREGLADLAVACVQSVTHAVGPPAGDVQEAGAALVQALAHEAGGQELAAARAEVQGWADAWVPQGLDPVTPWKEPAPAHHDDDGEGKPKGE